MTRLARKRQRFVMDTSVLVSAVNSSDQFHLPCYQWVRERLEERAIFVVPGLTLFEFQAAQSAIHRAKRRTPVYRELRLHDDNSRLYPLSRRFLVSVQTLALYDRFSMLKGADLVFACIAFVEGLPLVTRDGAFDRYKDAIGVINPVRDFHGLG